MNFTDIPSNYRQTTVNDGCPTELPSYRHGHICMADGVSVCRDGNNQLLTVNSSKPEQLQYAMTLCPVAGNWQTPPWQRLRGLLKTALRGYGLRAVACRPISPKDSQPQDNCLNSGSIKLSQSDSQP